MSPLADKYICFTPPLKYKDQRPKSQAFFEPPLSKNKKNSPVSTCNHLAGFPSKQEKNPVSSKRRPFGLKSCSLRAPRTKPEHGGQPVKKIALVTDSTADLTTALQKELNVHVVPLKVRFGAAEFHDHELSAEDFYRRLAAGGPFPQTAQPSPADFLSLYRKLLASHDAILSIHLSTNLSRT